MNEVIKSVGADNFEKEVLEKIVPVLVLCMHPNSELQGQIDILEDMCKRYGERLKICLIEDEFIGAFKERFKVKGTPTYLIFFEGTEEGRILGQIEKKTLEDFLLRTLFTRSRG